MYGLVSILELRQSFIKLTFLTVVLSYELIILIIFCTFLDNIVILLLRNI